MTDDQVLEGLDPIEERYTKKYSAHEINLLGDEFRWMTGDKWAAFCGIVLADGSKFIPSVKRFKEVYEVNKAKFPKVRKVPRGNCKECKGYGVRSWVKRGTRKGHFGIAAARCRCDNGENYPGFPPFFEVEKWPQFVDWVGVGETDIVAVARAEKAAREKATA